MNEALTKRLSSILSMNLKKGWTSVSYAIMRHGEIWAADSIGTQGGQEKKPADVNCTYNVASVSKIYCTVAVMQLVEQGKVSLDEPIVSYLPEFKMLDDRYRQITLRHCLSHSSGLPGTQWKHFSASDVSCDTYYQEVYDYMAHSYLKAAPGTYSVYCNDGFTMAEMVVAKVSGMSYAQYCMEHITEPIGAHSSRLSPLRNEKYPLVREGKKPDELLFIQGGAGYTTTMSDLCLFGKQFLGDSKLLTQASKDEMAKPQGVTFLPQDSRSANFGLGWDTVCFTDQDYDLGEGVLQKGGNSFQFTTQFLVIPKYDAVIAISETHDCGIDVSETGLRLFATAMLEEEGINIYKKYLPVPKEMAEKYQGTYLVPSAILNVHLYGAVLNVTRDDTRGGHEGMQKNLKWNGQVFEGDNDTRISFIEHEGDIFTMLDMRGKIAPHAMKAPQLPPVNEAWQARIGKRYVMCSASPWDLIPCELMTGFICNRLPGFDGILVASCSGRSDSGVYGLFEGSFAPVTDQIGTGFLKTPSNGSRDLITPCFEMRDGAEYCVVGSYTYRDAATLPEYAGQGFEGQYSPDQLNAVYRLASKLETLPEIPQGRRLIVLDDDMVNAYDSLMGGDYKPVEKGYLLFV